MIGFLRSLNREEGATIIVTSHDMDDLEEMARRILLISNGKISFDGDFSSLRATLGCTRRAVVTFTDGRQQEYPCEDTQALLRELSVLEGIADISFTQTSLEEGIAALYEKWKAG